MSHFFINRPKFAIVVSLVLMLAGAICCYMLPVEKYPNVTPPAVNVRTEYPGANAETVATALGAPIEEAVNGVDGMIYFKSSSSNSGNYNLNITFEPGSDPNMALVRVQNRINEISSILPQEVKNYGVVVEAAHSDSLGFISLSSPNGTYNESALLDYATDFIKKQFQRVEGIGKVQIYGAKYSMRIWLDPVKIASLGLSVSEITSAIQSQNKQAAIGSVGSEPIDINEPLRYSLQTQGRLRTAKEFEEVIVRNGEHGGTVRLKDIARVELGSEYYGFHSLRDGAPMAIINLAQRSGSNALVAMGAIKKKMAELETVMPEDMKLEIVHDSTRFVTATLKEILETLVLTFLLVVFVCFLFLQDWRITLVPVAAIPVSLLATFMGLYVMNYSINILSLFGIVLVIGTVVDDAIVVAERVQYIMERDRLSPKEATIQAMKDVSGPMAATTLVFLAIFVPVAFMEGIVGNIYRQFAVTISFAVMFSLLVAMTLSPAMCANMLKDPNEEKQTRKGFELFGWFNRGLRKATDLFVSGSTFMARNLIFGMGGMVLMGGLCLFAAHTFSTEFLPSEDNGMLFMSVSLPEGATSSRTRKVIEPLMEEIRQIPGTDKVVAIQGMDFMSGEGESVASFLVPLKPWDERKSAGLKIAAIIEKIRSVSTHYTDADIQVFSPPAINGMGMASGINVQLQSRQSNDPKDLERVKNQLLAELNQSEEVLYAFSSYNASTPIEYIDIDRKKAEMLNVPIGSLFSTLQTYLGSSYINDMNLGTQVNKVITQADWRHRTTTEKVGKLFVTNTKGGQVPVSSLISTKKKTGPRVVSRYNLYPAADITIMMKPGYSTGDGIKLMGKVATHFPSGFSYEFSGMTYQEQNSKGGLAILLCVSLIFAYLFLVAQYESFSVPISVICSLPVAILGALLGTKIMGISVSIYVQLGILLLVGLAGKNAILIIEFAKEQHEKGLSLLDAAAMACRERFRSVLMTAFTCVIGVAPMLFASGAGAGSRLAVGTTMFFGMLVATTAGIFFIPSLYVFFQRGVEKLCRKD